MEGVVSFPPRSVRNRPAGLGSPLEDFLQRRPPDSRGCGACRVCLSPPPASPVLAGPSPPSQPCADKWAAAALLPCHALWSVLGPCSISFPGPHFPADPESVAGRHSVSPRRPAGQGLPLGVLAGTVHLPRALPGAPRKADASPPLAPISSNSAASPSWPLKAPWSGPRFLSWLPARSLWLSLHLRPHGPHCGPVSPPRPGKQFSTLVPVSALLSFQSVLIPSTENSF